MNQTHPQRIFDGPRPARVEEQEELITMINLVFRSLVGRELTIGLDWPHVYAPQNLANVTVISDHTNEDGSRNERGKLVASTGVWACDVVIGAVKLRVGGINCVTCLPEYRRHGLGSQVMLSAHQIMSDLGCQVGLLGAAYTNWYRRLEWEEAGAMRSYRFNRGNIALLPPLASGVQMRFTTIEDEAALAQALALYQEARLGATRTLAAFHQLATAKRAERLVLAESTTGESAAAGYLLLRDHIVQEWAGAAATVAGLVRATFEALDDPNANTTPAGPEFNSVHNPLRNLTVETPGLPHPLPQLFDGLRIPNNAGNLGMLYLVDPQGVLDAYGLASLQLRQEGDRFVIDDGSMTLDCDRRQLTKLFFGPEKFSAIAGDRFPLPFWQWTMEKV
jgi:GNAT superfamily N-acetyltransferase